jgi:hypothetical protein
VSSAVHNSYHEKAAENIFLTCNYRNSYFDDDDDDDDNGL